MKKRFLTALVAGLLLLSACTAPASQPTATESAPAQTDDGTLHVLATTYPVYLFTTAVTAGVEGVEVSLLVNQQTSCLHDYTLTVNDMKAIDGADVIAMNGAGLEDFMDDALASSETPRIDCSEGIELRAAVDRDGHSHDGEYDPHIWMDPNNAAAMVDTLAARLGELDAANADAYVGNASMAKESLTSLAEEGTAMLSSLSHKELITFHDGFQYFAQAFGMDLLKAIEEEEGSEASAAEIQEMVTLVGEHDIPAIFTEVNGSDSTAQAIARETGCKVYQLNMIMSGDGTGLTPYLEAMEANLETLMEALG